MTKSYEEKPTLFFFRHEPNDLINLPPLASSLQHLETSFLLVATGRYPHALVTCGSAIESALKASINAKPNDRLDFKKLVSEAKRNSPNFTTLSSEQIKKFRFKRNEIIHYGYSTKDDSIAVDYLLDIGFNLIDHCYESFFQFYLHDTKSHEGSLLPKLSHHLRIAKKVYYKAKEKRVGDLTYCLISFAHQVRQLINHWMIPDWQMEFLNSEEESGSRLWEIQKRKKEELDFVFSASMEIDCPVCQEGESFVCELDPDQLERGGIHVKRGACVNCSLVIPEDCPFLIKELCHEHLEEMGPTTLHEYGIT